MERTTQGVVQGTRLTDAAGAALAAIDRVSRELHEHIGRISGQALSQAQSASVVASRIQHIFAATEQAEAGTRSTVQRVQELARSAEALCQSVARFKLQ
jgi:twitching motility protein PilJ